jgi:hypothetical protein
MTTLEILTIILALYGAVLSTILGIHELRKGLPKLKVSASHGYTFDAKGSRSEPVIILKAENIGSGQIHLNGVGWLNHNRSKQQFTNPYPRGILPKSLGERESLMTLYACRWFREKVKYDEVIGVFFQDETGKLWVGKVAKKDREMWSKSVGEGWKLN